RRVILVVSDGEDNFSDRIREAAIADYEARVKEEPGQVRAAARRRQEELHRRALADVQREVQRADVVFYSINPSGTAIRLNEISTRAQNNMKQVAEATGGNSFVPERLEDLDPVFRQIANELRAQYLLQYYSNGNAPAGKFLNIKVRVPARAGTSVRARQGYYAKKG
ncbi:MAG: VWA domain-containing protein, partial [Pyrinomonadaceae bacterium]